MKIPTAVGIAILCWFAPSDAVAQGVRCIAKGEVVVGVATTLNGRHPRGTPLSALGLRLSVPQCAIVFSIQDNDHVRVPRVSDIHLANGQGGAVIGHNVAIRLNDVFLPNTAYHLGDLISFDWEVIENDPKPGSDACRRFPNLC